MATKLTTSLVSLASAVLMALGAGAANAAPGDDAGPGRAQAASHRVENAEAAAAYWTSERMRSAVPGDVLARKAVERGVKSSEASVAKGSPAKVPGEAARPSGSTVSTIGKVFFTLGGVNYVCSGNAVASANRSTVSTAGHCLNEGPGAFATNFIFVPAYNNGAAPYGKWAATSLHTTTLWQTQGDISYDTGFAVVALPGSTNRLTDVVGSSGVQFNAARGLAYTAYGYPAAKPFTGETLKSCAGRASNDPYNATFTTQGIPCDMTGGSSGGPWFVGTGSGGTQNSVNSYRYGNLKVMYGPYWGVAIQTAYTTAAAS